MQVCVDFERKAGHVDAEKDAQRVEWLWQRFQASQSTGE
jgi:hypothetical protein